jgi:hypothetical protein
MSEPAPVAGKLVSSGTEIYVTVERGARLYSERTNATTGSRSRRNAGPLCNLHA